jgi:NADH-quinone oxidoreductase subunit G
MDAIGSNIIISTRGNEVMRILPFTNDTINEEWISDKTRFFYDGLKYQRLDTPMIREADRLFACSWEQALKNINHKIKSTTADKIGAIAGDLTDVETMLAMRDYLQALGSGNFDCRQNQSNINNKNRADYIFNTGIQNIEKADHCLLIGCNPRTDATMINARLRKAYLQNNLAVALIGSSCDLTYPYKYLGNNPWTLKQIADGEHPICKSLKNAKAPMLILGEAMTARDDFDAMKYYSHKLLQQYKYISDDWNGYNILHTAASRVGGLDIDFTPNNSNGLNTNEILQKCEIIFLLGSDEIDMKSINSKAFLIYIGHHGDKAAKIADVILPAAAFTEKNATYVNLEGRVQNSWAAVDPVGHAKVDWQIILDLASVSGITLPYSNLTQIRSKMVSINPIFKNIGGLEKHKFTKTNMRQKDFSSDTMNVNMANYYLTNAICRNSMIMQKCAKLHK